MIAIPDAKQFQYTHRRRNGPREGGGRGSISASVRKQQTTTTTSSTSSSSLGGKNKLRVLGRDHLKLSSLSNINLDIRTLWRSVQVAQKWIIIRSKFELDFCQPSRHHQQNQHNWWKVCWLYGGNGGNGGHHLLEQRPQGNFSHFNYHRSSKPTQVPTSSATSATSVASLHRSPSDVPKQQPTSSSSSISSFSAAVAATLPSHFRLRRRRQQRRDGAKNYLHSSKGDLKSAAAASGGDQQQQQPSITKGPEKCKSMMTLNISGSNGSSGSNQHQQNSSTSSSLFSFPSQLRLVEKINHHRREWMAARFCASSSTAMATSVLRTSSRRIISSGGDQDGRRWWHCGTGQQQMNIISTGKADAVELLLQLKGANWRHRQLQHQMPIHDAELLRQPTAESRFIRGKQRRALVRSELFLATTHASSSSAAEPVSGLASTIGWRAKEWQQHSSNSNSISSTTTTATAHHFFHIDCFKCEECQEVLVDLKAYLHPTTTTPSTATTFDHHHPHPHPTTSNNYLFCCRHFVEIFKPRCPHCDRLILDEECTEAEGKAWHIGHFCCTECSRSLGGQQYIMASSDVQQQLPYCLTCFDILFGELCEECGELIGCEVGAIIHEGRSWHATDACFRCSLCLKTLLGKPFLPAMDGRIYCSLTCSQAMVSHQREKARRSNRLHGLQQHETNQKRNRTEMVVQQQQQQQSPVTGVNGNAGDQEKSAAISVTNETKPTTTTTSNTIKENRDQFLKSMTLSRYEQKVKAQNQVQNNRTVVNGSPNLNQNTNSKQDCPVEDLAAARLKALNLSQLVNYEQFIRQSNQYFTSKYDWSKEQEFASATAVTITQETNGSVDQHEQAMSSSLTTATLSDAEESSSAGGIIKRPSNITSSSECSNSLERSSPAYFTGGGLLPYPHHHLYSTINHNNTSNNISSSQTTATTTSSTDNPPPRFTLPLNTRTTGDHQVKQTSSSSPSPHHHPHHHQMPTYYNLRNGEIHQKSSNSDAALLDGRLVRETAVSNVPAARVLQSARYGGGRRRKFCVGFFERHRWSSSSSAKTAFTSKMTNGILKSTTTNTSKSSPPLMEETLLVQKLLLSKVAAMEPKPSSSLEASPSPPATNNSVNNSDDSDATNNSSSLQLNLGHRQPSSVDTNNSPRPGQLFPTGFALQQQQQQQLFLNHHHQHLHPQQTSTPLSQQQQQQMMMQMMLMQQQQQQQMLQQRPIASGSTQVNEKQQQQPASATKSVSFDPNIEDKDESQRRYIRRLRSSARASQPRAAAEDITTTSGHQRLKNCCTTRTAVTRTPAPAAPPVRAPPATTMMTMMIWATLTWSTTELSRKLTLPSRTTAPPPPAMTPA
ncbi:Prickle-like protein 2 [Tyrophagus putrescentiae]|nr:Prickle-like protein 2 [Tyrophagus putrescentiae]